MIIYSFIPDIKVIKNAEKISELHEDINHHFGGTKESVFTGFVGEGIVNQILGLNLPVWKEADHGIDIKSGPRLIDVKTCLRSVPMQNYYGHNVCLAQSKDGANYYENNIYLFLSYNQNKNEIEICGWIYKEEFFNISEFHAEGTPEPSRKDGWCYKTDTRVVKNEKIWPFPSLNHFLFFIGGRSEI